MLFWKMLSVRLKTTSSEDTSVRIPNPLLLIYYYRASELNSSLIYKISLKIVVPRKIQCVLKIEHEVEITIYSDNTFFRPVSTDYRLNFCYCCSRDPGARMQWERAVWLPGKAGFHNCTVKIFMRVLGQPTRNPQQLSGRQWCCQWLCLSKGKDSLMRVLFQPAESPFRWVSEQNSLLLTDKATLKINMYC